MDHNKNESEDIELKDGYIKIPILSSNYGATIIGNPIITENNIKNELLISINVKETEHIFRFKNACKDLESGMIKFVFTFNCESTVLYIEYQNLLEFLVQLVDNKYYVDRDNISEIFNDLIENLDFYLLGYNPLIKKFTFSNIVNLINKIGFIIINYPKYEIKDLDQIKIKIQKRLYQLNNDELEDANKNKKNPGFINYNNNIESWENIFKKIWLLFNHLEKYNTTNIIKKQFEDNYFTLLDFIFDQNK
jgi:hypothetical protein